jgi:hypothetical protein
MSIEAAILELAAAIRAMAGSHDRVTVANAIASIPQPVVEAVAPPKKPGRPKKEVEPTAPASNVQPIKPAPEIELEDFGAAEDAPTDPATTLDECRVALMDLAAKKGRPAALEVLQRFGVSKLTDLDADRYGELVKRCTAASSAADDELDSIA